MSNGVRHGLGIVAGLILPPLIAVGLMYGVAHLTMTMAQRFELSFLGIGLIVACAAALAFLVGSRLSPVASLMGGLLYVLLGVVPMLTLLGVDFRLERMLPPIVRSGYTSLALQGILLMLGVMLLVASMFPSRWRGTAKAAAPAYPGYGPPSYPGAAEPGPYQGQPYARDPYTPDPYAPEPPYGGEPRPEDTTRPMHRE